MRQANRPRDPSDDYDDDYEDQEIIRAQVANGEDDLSDTTMLDSVVLPAIASVRLLFSYHSRRANLTLCDPSYSLVSRHKKRGSPSVHSNERSPTQNESSLE